MVELTKILSVLEGADEFTHLYVNEKQVVLALAIDKVAIESYRYEFNDPEYDSMSAWDWFEHLANQTGLNYKLDC